MSEPIKPLVWTMERPTGTGYFWLRALRQYDSQQSDHPVFVGVVSVSQETQEGSLTYRVLRCYQDGKPCEYARWFRTEWAGPIPTPLEPGQVTP